MGARAIWKGVVCVGAERVPVRLYSAVQAAGVSFRLLHREDQSPVKQQLLAPDQARPVPPEEQRKGLEVEAGVFVVLRPEELRALQPPPSREIRVEEVIPAGLDLRWFDHPYLLGPDGDEPGYFALAELLEARRRLAIVRWVMRRRHYQGALHARRGHLALSTLRHPEELVAVERVQVPAGRAPDRRELALAEQLVEALADDFDPAAYQDEHRARVRSLIEAKARGLQPALPRPEAAPAPSPDLAGALEASLRATRRSARG